MHQREQASPSFRPACDLGMSWRTIDVRTNVKEQGIPCYWLETLDPALNICDSGKSSCVECQRTCQL